MSPSSLDRWLLRLLTGALLFYGVEVLLWTGPGQLTAVGWGVVIVGNGLLGAVLLDTLVRYHLRDLWGVMTLAGLYGLIAGVLLHPESALVDFPRTLITRALGAYTFITTLTVLGLLALLGLRRRFRLLLLIGAAFTGALWGTWVRWAPSQTGVAFEPVDLITLLLWGAGGLLPALLLFALIRRRRADLSAADLLLTPLEWLVVGTLLVVLLGYQWITQQFDSTMLILIATLLTMAAAVLWFRRETRRTDYLTPRLPVIGLPLPWLLLTVGVLLWFGVLAFSLPLFGSETFNQLTVVVFAFALYGLGWLPLVSLVLGVRAYFRQTQRQKL